MHDIVGSNCVNINTVKLSFNRIAQSIKFTNWMLIWSCHCCLVALQLEQLSPLQNGSRLRSSMICQQMNLTIEYFWRSIREPIYCGYKSNEIVMLQTCVEHHFNKTNPNQEMTQRTNGDINILAQTKKLQKQQNYPCVIFYHFHLFFFH